MEPGNRNTTIRIAATGDIHAKHTDKGKWAPLFNKASDEADILLICGDLTDTGFSFDVGIQGDLGDVAVLGNLLLFTDKFSGATGLYSFTIQPDGSFTQNGSLVSSQGTTPTYIAVWEPPSSVCHANCDSSTAAPILNVSDFVCFLNKYAAGDSYANCDSSTLPPILNVNDFVCFNTQFAVGCP